jgi:outer membrane protein assembly factor BamD (BamD/ComL family)
MKLIGSPKRVVVVILVSLSVVALGFEARRIMIANGIIVDPRIANELDKRFDQQAQAPRLMDEARRARQSGDAKEALRLLTELQKKYPDGFYSSWGLVITAEMVAKQEAPAELLPQIYQCALASKDARSAWERAKLLPYVRDMDAANGWKLGWQLILQAYGPGGQGSSMADASTVRESEGMDVWKWSFPIGSLPGENVLATMTDTVRKSEGEQAVSKLLEKVLETPTLAEISGQAVELLLHQAEMSQGAEAAATLAMKLAKERGDTPGGTVAFQYACDATLHLKGDAEMLSFLKECAKAPGDGLVQQAARSRLAAYFVGQNDPENAVAVYCGNAGPDGMLALSAQTLEQAADNVVKDANRKDVTTVGLLETLAGKASERKLLRISGALYERAGLILHAPELKANEKETPFAEADASMFWQAYILWRGDDGDKGREMYEKLLPKYVEGWQVAQMLYDLAKGHMASLRYEEAVACAERGLKALPENAVMLTLRKEAQVALEKDKTLSDQIVTLRKEAESALEPLARAECCMKIARAESERKNYDDALKEYREVWEKFPETSDAPKAMYAAAEILVDQVQDERAAKEVIENLVLTYPSSDLSAKAFALLKKVEGK